MRFEKESDLFLMFNNGGREWVPMSRDNTEGRRLARALAKELDFEDDERDSFPFRPETRN